MADIEQELGYSIKDGKNMEVDEMRRLAHILILEAEGHVAHVVEEPQLPEPVLLSLGRKRPRLDEQVEESIVVDNGGLVKRVRPSRKSMTVKSSQDAIETLANAKRARRSLAPQVMSRPAETSVLMGNVIEEMENPTPQMLEMMKRKSSTKATPKEIPEMKKRLPVIIEDGFPGVAFQDEDGNKKQCKIFVALADPTKINYKSIHGSVPEFAGANLSVVHTPAEWDPAQIFSMVQTIRTVNRTAGLDSFTVLIGCGLTNVHMFREALLRQTKHVQLVACSREDQNLDLPDGGKLRETVSLFLLAYFFPKCDAEDSKLPEPMVRPGVTNCLQARYVSYAEVLFDDVYLSIILSH
jgi:hypothetical protein